MLSDDFIMPIGFHKGERLADIPMRDLDGLVGWLEEKGKVEDFRELYDGLVEYLRAQGYEAEDEL
jgi:hypothetical protein